MMDRLTSVFGGGFIAPFPPPILDPFGRGGGGLGPDILGGATLEDRWVNHGDGSYTFNTALGSVSTMQFAITSGGVGLHKFGFNVAPGSDSRFEIRDSTGVIVGYATRGPGNYTIDISSPKSYIRITGTTYVFTLSDLNLRKVL